MAPTALLGPPELYHSIQQSESQESENAVPAASTDPFIDLMMGNFNELAKTVEPPMGLTENMSATYLSSGNPCLDFFFHVVPSTPPDSLIQRLTMAWDHDPLTSLKLICNLRGVRGTGKSDKEGYYTAALWLHKHHPKTLACNISSFADFGYFKDLPEILYRLLEGSNEAPMKERGLRQKKLRGRMKAQSTVAVERSKLGKGEASVERKRRKVSMAKKAVERYGRDSDYRFLFEKISDFFAKCLKSDLEFLNSGDLKKLSLAAKWCPSIDSSFDRSTLLCESIARKLFPRELYSEYEGIEDAHYAYRVRDRLRKQVLVPIRKILELPEVYIGANRWDLIPYNRVASVAMKFYKDKFMKHDEKRFTKYLQDVRTGKTKISAGALLPHEIIKSLNDDQNDNGQVAELQWKRMVSDLSNTGKLRNCISICDVSGSMDGIPMEVSVALGLLISELSEDPWKGKLITFSENPELHLIKGDDLKSKSNFVRAMEWGMNTDFQKVFDLILKVAVDGKLKQENMIKRLFVFSDMEFDQASANSWETDYQVIERKFTEKGYGSAVPQIVFWNLRDSRATPVPATKMGVALVSGFSKNLINLFLENEGVIDPVTVMGAAVSGENYQKLFLVD